MISKRNEKNNNQSVIHAAIEAGVRDEQRLGVRSDRVCMNDMRVTQNENVARCPMRCYAMPSARSSCAVQLIVSEHISRSSTTRDDATLVADDASHNATVAIGYARRATMRWRHCGHAPHTKNDEICLPRR